MVPDLSAPEVILSTPRVWFARNAREFTALTAGRAARADRDARVPPHRSPAGSLRRLRARRIAPTTVTAQLLNQQGTKMIGCAGDRAGRRRSRYSIDLPLANLAAGQYLLEITANARRPQARDRARGLPTRILRVRITVACRQSGSRLFLTSNSDRLTSVYAYIPRSFVTVATRLIATM